ncbi:MAG: glutamyl-tRNA amidotransferase [Bdellovibrionales bacterium CG10_big_fil_rev_8_21_14_0_10_45_34]|nr:MAG: glutamyl-tRNA amidotransferase [Bdellovibrionales bacterium CG10_big_fil_rev_8_21_14_0_10_45_34]
MNLKALLTEDMKTAMKEKNSLRLGAIRFLQSALKNREIELRPEPMSDDEAFIVLKKLAKQRKESIDQYQQAGRQDLVEKEQAELAVLEEYLPKMLSEEETQKLVASVVSETGATSVKEMGRVMKEVLAQAGGRADNKLVSDLVKKQLGQ